MKKSEIKKHLEKYVQNPEGSSIDMSMSNAILLNCLIKELVKNKIIQRKAFDVKVENEIKKQNKKFKEFFETITKDEELLNMFNQDNLDYVG